MFVKRSAELIAVGAALLGAVAAVAGFGAGESSATAATATGKPPAIRVARTGLGRILVDSHGRTLYMFTRDSDTVYVPSACTGACAAKWPPALVTGTPTVGRGVKASLVSTADRGDGKPQLTYNDHPLYLYEEDGKPGDTKGENTNEFGGDWYALSPAGSAVRGPASSGRSNAAAAVSSPTAAAKTNAGTTVQVKGGEFFFRLSTKAAAKPGTVTFVFTNVGHVQHDFRINGKQTPLTSPGQTARLVVTFKKKGSYAYLCTVPGHAAAGMKGVFAVR